MEMSSFPIYPMKLLPLIIMINVGGVELEFRPRKNKRGRNNDNNNGYFS
jgi:hypothetical protein